MDERMKTLAGSFSNLGDAASKAMRRAAVANQIAEFAAQNHGVGVAKLSAELWRQFEAREQGRTAEWARQQDEGTASTLRLAAATRLGTEAVAEQQIQERIEDEVRKQGEAVRLTITASIRAKSAARKELARSGIAAEIDQNRDLAAAALKSDAAYKLLAKTQAIMPGHHARPSCQAIMKDSGLSKAEAEAQAAAWLKSTNAVESNKRALEMLNQQNRRTLDQMKSDLASFDGYDELAGKHKIAADEILRQAADTQAEELRRLEERFRDGEIAEAEYLRTRKRMEEDHARESFQIAKDLARRRDQEQFGPGALAAARDYFQSLQQHGKLAGEFLTNSVFKPLEGTLSNFFKSGEASLKTFKKAIVSGMADLAAKLVMSGASSMASGVVKSIGEAVGSSTVGQYVKSLFASAWPPWRWS